MSQSEGWLKIEEEWIHWAKDEDGAARTRGKSQRRFLVVMHG